MTDLMIMWLWLKNHIVPMVMSWHMMWIWFGEKNHLLIYDDDDDDDIYGDYYDDDEKDIFRVSLQNIPQSRKEGH